MSDPLQGRRQWYKELVDSAIISSGVAVDPDWSNIMRFPAIANIILPFAEQLKNEEEVIAELEEVLEDMFQKLHTWCWP